MEESNTSWNACIVSRTSGDNGTDSGISLRDIHLLKMEPRSYEKFTKCQRYVFHQTNSCFSLRRGWIVESEVYNRHIATDITADRRKCDIDNMVVSSNDNRTSGGIVRYVSSNNDQNFLSHLQNSCCSQIEVRMNAHLVGCVASTMAVCPLFVQRFLNYVKSSPNVDRFGDTRQKRHRRRLDNSEAASRGRSDMECWLSVESNVCLNGTKKEDDRKVKIGRLVVLHLVFPSTMAIDLAWFYRLEQLIIKHATLDDALNWLSTLGGAYSALGDHFPHHAENAARISLQQLGVALEMGSPPIVIRCHLYLALSLMQRGKLRKSRLIISRQYDAAKRLIIQDTHLLAMCRGLWSRLQYLYRLRGSLRKSADSSAGFIHVME